MSLLTITQDVMVEVGLSRPAAAISSTDPGVVATISMINQTGLELMRRFEWQALQTEKTFTSVAQASQTSAVPTDFDRFVNESFWNRTQKRQVAGPLTPQQWQSRQASSIGGITDFYRMRGSAILIDPVPSAGNTMAYEYISKYWVGGTKVAMTADSDTSLIDENLLKLGAIWRYLKSRNMDYSEEYRTFETEVLNAAAKDGGKGVLSLAAPRSRNPLAPYAPEGSWSL